MKNSYNIAYRLFFLLSLQCLPFFMAGQITFQKVYGSFYDRTALDVIPTYDGGYIMAAMTNNNIMDDIDFCVIKTNNTGDTIWTRTYGGGKPDYPFSILETNDSNYFVLGYSQSFGGGDYDAYLIKINSSGDTLWTKTYGSWGNDQGREIIPTADGNYMIVGSSTGLSSSSYDAILIKIDPTGNIIWEKNYGGSASDFGNSVKECMSGGFIFVGQTYSYGQRGDIYMVRTDSIGDTTWTKTFGGAQADEGIFVLANNDGSFVFCARDSSSGNDVDIQIIKTNSVGGIVWDKNYGGAQKDTDKMIQPTSDGGYIVAGISRSFGWLNPDMWLLKLNGMGDTIWTRHYGGFDHEHCHAARQTADGGFIAVGHTESFSTTNEIMFLKLNQIGQFGPFSYVDKFSLDNAIVAYPNPTDGFVKIELSNTLFSGTSESIFRISNLLGETILSEVIDPSNQSTSKIIDLQDKEPGVYFLTIESGNYSATQKLLLNK